LICAIKHFSLHSLATEYNALSYTWGAGTSSKTIWLNDKTFLIHDNLYIALQHLRDESRELLLWIDAICINQADDIEKARQVQLMRQIYAASAETAVWLGEAADDSDLAFDSISNLSKGTGEMYIDDWADLLSRINTIDDEEATFPLDAMTALLGRPWWSRIWVVQEVASAQQVLYFCGNKTASDVQICVALMIFYRVRDELVLKTIRTDYESRFVSWQSDLRPWVIIGLLQISPRKSEQLLKGFLVDFYMVHPSSDHVMQRILGT
jgi:Heterokaryon incompatibility protein (HET)